MRLAAIQHATSPGADEMARLLDTVRDALTSGADFVVLPERPVPGLSKSDCERFGVLLVRATQESSAAIVGCNLLAQDETECVDVLSPGGDVTARLPVRVVRGGRAGGIETARTALGELAVMSGTDCFAQFELARDGHEHPRVLVLQVSAASTLEREAIRELALARSEAQVSLVIVTSLAGPVGGSRMHGGSAVMLQGETLAEAGDGAETLVVDIDPGDFVDLSVLHHPIRVPELLKQKLEHL